MNILEAYDLTGALQDAAELACVTGVGFTQTTPSGVSTARRRPRTRTKDNPKLLGLLTLN